MKKVSKNFKNEDASGVGSLQYIFAIGLIFFMSYCPSGKTFFTNLKNSGSLCLFTLGRLSVPRGKMNIFTAGRAFDVSLLVP